MTGKTKAIEAVRAYHERTKHDLQRGFARSRGFMDWSTQPDPFRDYAGADPVPLDRLEWQEDPGPPFDLCYAPEAQASGPLNEAGIARLLYDSLAVSAWKSIGAERWPLRCNPSSGNLHPTEAHLLLDWQGEPGLFHYNPRRHLLERRRQIPQDLWDELRSGLPPNSLLVALSSIFWRESWKYGERAFRYCQHDCGHAIAGLSWAAAALGHATRLLPAVSDDTLALLLGIDDQQGIEAEHPDCLLAVYPANSEAPAEDWRPSAAVMAGLAELPLVGVPNQLSDDHHPWEVIDEVAASSAWPGAAEDAHGWSPTAGATSGWSQASREIGSRKIFRTRRSAVAMDRKTHMTRSAFLNLLARTDSTGMPFSTLPWRPAVHPLLFVHRVEDLTPGFYLYLREPDAENELRAVMRPEFSWEIVTPDLPGLRLLEAGDAGRVSKLLSCQQDIAADGVFAVAMLARFDASLEERGPAAYRHLHWEAGALGQLLYLESEAAGLRGTGIGCYFDDGVHGLAGIKDTSWQSLYHFTLGGPLDDPRLQTLPAYQHLDDEEGAKD